jgi:hypothetical protein
MKNVIYCINCRTCKRKYIGETSQQFVTRKNQHIQDVKNKIETNGIYNHLKVNKKHIIEWNKEIFLDTEAQWTKRKIKESLYINACDPKEKPEKLLNLEKGLKINTCWNEFNGEIRRMVQKISVIKVKNREKGSCHESARGRRKRTNHCR